MEGGGGGGRGDTLHLSVPSAYDVGDVRVHVENPNRMTLVILALNGRFEWIQNEEGNSCITSEDFKLQFHAPVVRGAESLHWRCRQLQELALLRVRQELVAVSFLYVSLELVEHYFNDGVVSARRIVGTLQEIKSCHK